MAAFLEKARKIKLQLKRKTMPGPLAAMGIAAGTAAAQTAGQGLIGTGMGLLTAKWADKRQLRQQQKLQDLQIKGNKELTDYNMMKELEMWEKTGYGAQKEQMKKAGLNPGLMYGMGGGGGQTASISPGSIGSGNAPAGGGEIQAFTGMALQNALIDAQRRNIEADTKNKEKQGENITADTVLKQIQADWDRIELEVKGRSKEDAIRKIWYEADEMAYKANLAQGESEVQTAPTILEARRQEIMARATKAIIEKDLAEMLKGKTQAEIDKIRQDIENSIQQLKNQGKQVDNDTIRTMFETNLGNRLSMEAVRAIGGVVNMYLSKKTTDVNK